MRTATELAARLREGLARVIVGNEESSFALLVAALAGGHVLLEGAPGTAKTLFVRTMARLLSVGFARIQFTPDLMPSDIVGTNVFSPKSGEFTLRHGPIFANFVLADEVNRTPPKTQSALLEAMEEGRVTIDGESHSLPSPFMIFATQNPIEFEGTYPLPEAQRDRFLVRALTGYPNRDEELALLKRAGEGFDSSDLSTAGIEPVANSVDLLRARADVQKVRIAQSVREYLYTIVASTRDTPSIELGASPRAAIALLRASQASAVIADRDFVTPDDVKAVATCVLAHRLILEPEAELEGVTTESATENIVADIPVPKEAAISEG